MVKVSGRTPTGLLLLPYDLVKDNLVIQCPNILINISGNMGVAATRVSISTPRQPYTRTRPQFRAGCTGAAMDALNYGVGWYQS